MSPKKRILLVVLFIVVSIGIGIGIYFLFFRAPIVAPPAAPTPPAALPGLPTALPGRPTVAPPTITPPLPTIPTIAQGGPTQTTALTEEPVKDATLASDGRSIAYYNEGDGRFYRITPDGIATRLSERQFFNVQNVTWSPGADRAVLEYPDGANIMFDFETDRQVTLPKHWEEFSFSSDGEDIAALSIGVNINNRWLVASNADGSEARAVEPLGENADRVMVSWSPSDQTIAFSDTGEEQGLDTSEILVIGQNHENFKSLIVEGRDFRPLWNTDGQRLLYSVYNAENNYRPTLWVSDSYGDSIGANRRSIGLNTWADKCSFTDISTAYCAVPTSLPDGYGLQPQLANSIPDQIYKIDISTGTRTLVGSPAEDASISSLMVSDDGRYLFYTDAQTGILRRMQLR